MASVIGAGSTNVLKNGTKYQLSEECREIDEELYAPEEFFTSFMGISIASENMYLTAEAGDRRETVNISEEPEYAEKNIDGIKYFPAEKICAVSYTHLKTEQSKNKTAPFRS